MAPSIPDLHSQDGLTRTSVGLCGYHTEDTVQPSKKGEGGAVDARTLPALQGSFPFHGAWSHPSPSPTGQRPPWLESEAGEEIMTS